MAINDSSFRAEDFTVLTIATGAVTATKMLHTIAAETGTADDLATITAGHSDLSAAGNTYRPLLIIKADTGDTITLKHGTGNIQLGSGADYALTGDRLISFFYDGTNWIEVSSSSVSATALANSLVNINEGSDYTTTSTSFVDIDSAGDPDLSLTITTNGGDVMIGFDGGFSHSAATSNKI